MTYGDALVYGLIQGISEFLPVSSSAHLALLPNFLSIEDPGVFFDLLMHGGTVFAVGIYFYREFWQLILGAWSLLRYRKLEGAREIYAFNFLLATTLTVAVVLLLKPLAFRYGRNPDLIGLNLIFFGFLLYAIDRWFPQKIGQPKGLAQWPLAAFVGLAQGLAIFPGVSRLGITLSAARLGKIERIEAAYFSFLLSFPLIIGGMILGLGEIQEGLAVLNWKVGLVGFITAFGMGLISINFFLRLLSRWGLLPIIIYRVILGIMLFNLSF